MNFRTTDIALAAFLVLRSHPIIVITPHDDSRVSFEFESDAALDSLVLEFFNRQTTVEPLGLMEAVKSLKALINQGVVQE